MKYALLRQQPLLEVQVASFKHFFLKKEIQSFYSLKGGGDPKQNKKQKTKQGGSREQNAISKRVSVSKTKYIEVWEGRRAFQKCIEICFEILTLVNL